MSESNLFGRELNLLASEVSQPFVGARLGGLEILVHHIYKELRSKRNSVLIKTLDLVAKESLAANLTKMVKFLKSKISQYKSVADFF